MRRVHGENRRAVIVPWGTGLTEEAKRGLPPTPQDGGAIAS